MIPTSNIKVREKIIEALSISPMNPQQKPSDKKSNHHGSASISKQLFLVLSHGRHSFDMFIQQDSINVELDLADSVFFERCDGIVQLLQGFFELG